MFSRNSENMSAKYPDLVEQIPRVSLHLPYVFGVSCQAYSQCIKEGVKSFVIDAEAVAFDLETKKLLPFQDLSRRKRKDVRTEDITVRVHLFAFDLLYLNGEVSFKFPSLQWCMLQLTRSRACCRSHSRNDASFSWSISSLSRASSTMQSHQTARRWKRLGRSWKRVSRTDAKA